MRSLPVCLPVAVTVCWGAAGVFAVLMPVCGWIDWREAQWARERPSVPVSRPNAPRRHPRRVEGLTKPHSATEALNAPQAPAAASDPPEPHPTPAKPPERHTAHQETP